DYPKAALKALALLAQHNRFRRPSSALSVSAKPLFADGRAVIAENMRPLLLSVLSHLSKRELPYDAISLAIADAMACRQVTVHPFDLPRLEDFVRAHSEQLGPGAVAWAKRHAGDTNRDSQDYSFVETIDETNWLRARPAQKSAFIYGLRKSDPARARQLVEAA